MRRIELLFAALLVPLDYLTLMAAAWLAYTIRFDSYVLDIREAVYTLPATDFVRVTAISSLAMIIIFAWNGLYTIAGTRRIVDEFRKIFLACSTGVMIVIILFFFNRELFSSRFIILITWGFSILLVSAMRLVVIKIERNLFSKGLGVHRVLLIGDSRTARILYETIESSPALGLQVVERTKEFDNTILEKTKKILRLKHIDEIISADPNITRLQTAQLIEFCQSHHIAYKYAADIFDAQVSNISLRPIAGIPIVELLQTPLQGWRRIYKRVIDLLFSILAIVIFGPLMLIVAILIKLDSPGPIIYKNLRVGENGKKFYTLKFRSMKQEYCISDENPNNQEALQYEQQLIQEKSIKAGPVYKIQDDPRVTRMGKFIRKTSLDEFPQFFNVLIGNMSMVGPRPHQPREVQQYQAHHRSILSIKPGVTGLSQISGRSDLQFDEEVRLDKYYMENWSLLFDVYIIFKTPFILFKKRQAI